MGGVFNLVNMHVYHYAGNNPVKLTDPNGRQSDSDVIVDDLTDYDKALIIYKIVDTLMKNLHNEQEQRKIFQIFSGININAQLNLVEEYAKLCVEIRKANFEMRGDKSNVEDCPDYKMFYDTIHNLFSLFTMAYNEYGRNSYSRSLALGYARDIVLRFINTTARIEYDISKSSIDKIATAIKYKRY